MSNSIADRGYDILKIDCEKECNQIVERLRDAQRRFRRRGAVVAVSGGIDSSVTLGLCVRAFGALRTVSLQMPERHSAEETLQLSGLVADRFGVEKIHEDISGILESVGFYRRYDENVRKVIPEYGTGWKSKITLPLVGSHGGINFYSVVAQTPSGEVVKQRLPLEAYLGIVAATNFKQRIRKMLEYYHADRLNYVTTGTPNRLEYDQGFFVKLGDGAADVKPIAHLYKSQVYQMAEYLGVPEEIRKRPPTTDTYSLPQSQDEFYFLLPYDKMDMCLYGKNNGIDPQEVAKAIGIGPDQVTRVYDDIAQKRRSTEYLHAGPVLVGEVPEITAKVLHSH